MKQTRDSEADGLSRPTQKSGVSLTSVTVAVAVGCAIGFAPALSAQQSPAPTPTLAPGPPPLPQDRAAALQAEGERLARESRTLLGELRKLEIERDLQAERARQAAAAVNEATQAMARADSRLTTIASQRAAQLPDLKARLVELYKRGRAGNARLLLGASNVRDFARTTRAVASMARLTETRLGEHQRLLNEAQDERVARAEALSRLQAESRKVEQSRAAAARAVRTRTALLADIDKRRDLTAQLAGELEVAARRLNEQVSAVAIAPPPALASPTAPVFPPRMPVRGGLEWPLDGRVIGRFGEASTRAGGNAPRNGLEIEAADGTPARAIHAGSVVFAGPLSGFGTLVIVDHARGYHSVYGYLSSTTLTRGDVVDVGREVGRIGAIPGGPPALYFEFRIDGRSVDPLQWLRPR